MSIAEEGLTPVQFPELETLSDDVVIWVIVNDTDYHVTAGQLKEWIGGGGGNGGGVTQQQLQTQLDNYLSLGQLKILEGRTSEQSVLPIATKEEVAALAQTIANIPDTTAVLEMGAVSARELHVVGGSNVEDPDGSIFKPFNTIQQAIDALPPSVSSSVIKVAPSLTDLYPGFTVDNRINLLIQGYGVTDAHPVKIQGTVTLEGADTTRVRLKDLSIQAFAVGQRALEINGTLGRHFFENVTFSGSEGNAETIIEFLADAENWVDFHNCNIDGKVVIRGDESVNSLVAFRGGNSPHTEFLISGTGTVRINDFTRIGVVRSTGGKVHLDNVRNFEGDLANIGIQISGPTEMTLNTVNLRRENASFAYMRKTGNESTVRLGYTIISHEDLKNMIDVEYMDFGTVAHVLYYPTNYTIASGTLEAHLKGIDEKLGELANQPQ